MLNTDNVFGINEALKKGLVLKFYLNPLGNHRYVILIDPREEPEFDRKIYGFGQDGDFELSLLATSRSYLNNGKCAGPWYGCCALGYYNQSFSDRFITAGGTGRAYQKDNNKNKLTLMGNNGNYIIRLETGPDFAETANFMEDTLKEREDIFRSVWASIPKSEKSSYQNPKGLFSPSRPYSQINDSILGEGSKSHTNRHV